ncbi:hypothetical protein MHBO_001050 [Bonamia ostreae]|uniref:Uncharacterized protein n=1 Tax=Bonamia ostreae TaxID=126728 RepID=A0ABV2AHN8_9EUKA
MQNLSPAKMLSNERKLDTERAKWICEKALDSGSFYNPAAAGRFTVYEAENYLALYASVQPTLDDTCENVDVEAILNRVNALKILPNVTDSVQKLIKANLTADAPIPSTFVEAVGQAHAQELFVEYSLANAPPYESTAMDKLSVLGIFLSAFIIQQAVFGIYCSLLNKSLKSWRIVQTGGMVMVYLLYITMALVGYFGQLQLVGETVFEKMNLRYFVDTGEIDYGF